jgi:hypothetical protein
MNNKEHKEYLNELRTLTSKLLESKEASADFYKSAGIHTKSGNLRGVYTSASNPIGYKPSKPRK